MTTIKRVVLVGLGNIGQGLLPALSRNFQAELIVFEMTVTPRHRELARQYNATLHECQITEQNFRRELDRLLDKQTALLNFAVSVSTVDLVHLAQEHAALYLDSCIEPWEYGADDSGALQSNFKLRDALKKMQGHDDQKSTALVAHGANPGFISILLKKALFEMARINGLSLHSDTQDGWARLAHGLGIRTIQISERDSQVESGSRSVDEFVCTWSVDGFITECLQPAELGWGSHETDAPVGSTLHMTETQAVLKLATMGKDTRVRSWSPNYLDFIGYILTHNESLSISEYLTREVDGKTYRPTVFYAYHPCDGAIESLSLLAGNNEARVKSKRVLKDEIASGIDELGIFLISDQYPSLWVGSNLDIGKARNHLSQNNATSLQVVSGVVAALHWMEKNPMKGVIESEQLDWQFVYEHAVDCWSPIVITQTDWNPNGKEKGLEFKNFLIEN